MRLCVCVCACTFNICALYLCVCVCLSKGKKERPLPLPPTCSCNPLCFGDLGNLVTKHSWGPFDWGHGRAWSLVVLKRQRRRESRMEEEEEGWPNERSVQFFPFICLCVPTFGTLFILYRPLYHYLQKMLFKTKFSVWMWVKWRKEF